MPLTVTTNKTNITTADSHGFRVGDRLKIHITVAAVIRGFHRAMRAPRKDYKRLCRQAVENYHRLYGSYHVITAVSDSVITMGKPIYSKAKGYVRVDNEQEDPISTVLLDSKGNKL